MPLYLMPNNYYAQLGLFAKSIPQHMLLQKQTLFKTICQQLQDVSYQIIRNWYIKEFVAINDMLPDFQKFSYGLVACSREEYVRGI
jgi:hypothetical protein